MTNSGNFRGHPIGLYVLFFAEMWERFSFYGMRGLLKLYMVNYLFVTSRQIRQGSSEMVVGTPDSVWAWETIRSWISLGDLNQVGAQASIIYGWYTGLVYLTPLVGGWLADRYWGQRRTVLVGGALMAAGHFVMAFENYFFVALLLLILGNGAFKPNVSTQVGQLYDENDPRRDGAFTLFYMGINIGAFLSSFVCGSLAAVLGWHWGFGAAGVGMVLGLIVYIVGGKHLPVAQLSKAQNSSTNKTRGQDEPLTANEWLRIYALLGLCVLNIIFWAVYEQQGNTMQTWADERTEWPVIMGFQVPSTWFQSFNPLFIFILAPVLEVFWRWQARSRSEPTSVIKMAIGCIVLGSSFLIMIFSATVFDGGKASWFWPVLATFFLTIGELYLSPIGLSLVTKTAPARIVSFMMGIWFLSSFFGNLLSGYLGVLLENQIFTPVQFFSMLLFMGLAAGLGILLMSRPLKSALLKTDS